MSYHILLCPRHTLRCVLTTISVHLLHLHVCAHAAVHRHGVQLLDLRCVDQDAVSARSLLPCSDVLPGHDGEALAADTAVARARALGLVHLDQHKARPRPQGFVYLSDLGVVNAVEGFMTRNL